MQKTILGRTQLSVTVAGLGTGGHSKIGYTKFGPAHAASIVKSAFDMGVNFFDSSEAYGTEGAVGEGLAGISRDKYVISTKFSYTEKDGSLKSTQAFWQSLEQSLRLLKTDYVDIYNIHGLSAKNYAAAVERFYPEMQKAIQRGWMRFPGVTELFNTDRNHEMLSLALEGNLFDVVMVGHNIINPSASAKVFPITKEKNIGTLCMFAVRTALSNPAALQSEIQTILAAGQGNKELLLSDGDLAFLTQNGAASSIMEAAYRFCRHTSGMDVVLTGTANPEHLTSNLAAINMPPLPEDVLAKLQAMFQGVDCVSGE